VTHVASPGCLWTPLSANVHALPAEQLHFLDLRSRRFNELTK